MQYRLYAVCGVCGAVLSWCFGGWDAVLQMLIVCMAADYLTGLLVAGIFRHSPKTPSGGLHSGVGFQGLVKKSMMLLFVLIAHQLDAAMGLGYIRDGVCVAFAANELVSIIENAGLMGIPIPSILQDAIDLLKQKGDHRDD